MLSKTNTIVEGLWNENILEENYPQKEKYQEHLFEQYKLYVEMTDRISSRRNLANTFFLTFHTLIMGVSGFLYEKGPSVENKAVIIIPLLANLALCFAWWRLVKSYRQINSAKFKVIGEFEKRLPASPYWSAEWKAMIQNFIDHLQLLKIGFHNFCHFVHCGSILKYCGTIQRLIERSTCHAWY